MQALTMPQRRHFKLGLAIWQIKPSFTSQWRHERAAECRDPMGRLTHTVFVRRAIANLPLQHVTNNRQNAQLYSRRSQKLSNIIFFIRKKFSLSNREWMRVVIGHYRSRGAPTLRAPSH